MRVKIIDYKDITDIIPCIEGRDTYSIVITFYDGTCMNYAYMSKENMLSDYRYLVDAWIEFGEK